MICKQAYINLIEFPLAGDINWIERNLYESSRECKQYWVALSSIEFPLAGDINWMEITLDSKPAPVAYCPTILMINYTYC